MKSTALSLYHIFHCNADCNCQLYPSLFASARISVTFSSGCFCNTERHRQAVTNDLCGTSLTTCLCVGNRGAAAGQHRWWHHSVVLFWNRWPPIHPSVCCRELHVKVATGMTTAIWFNNRAGPIRWSVCSAFVSFQDVAYLGSVCAGQSVSSFIMTWICVTLELEPTWMRCDPSAGTGRRPWTDRSKTSCWSSWSTPSGKATGPQ